MRTLVVVATVICAGVFAAAAAAGPPQARPDTDSFDRVAAGVAAGDLTQTQAVLLQAKLLFDKDAVTTAEAKLLAGRLTVAQPCLTDFFDEVQAAYAQLTPAQRDYLAALDQNLAAIMAARAAEAAGRHITALPNFNLDKTLEGQYCTVNYTLKGDNAVPNLKYAQRVRNYVDWAIEAETKKFRAAYAEGGGKMQVYVYKTAEDRAWWTPVSAVPGAAAKARSGYINIFNKGRYNDDSWKTDLMGNLYHEYFHGVQSAYNDDMQSWFKEGTAMWAMSHYGDDYGNVKVVLNYAQSCCRRPWLPLWDDSLHKYSTVAFVYYLANQYGGEDFIKECLEALQAQDDAFLMVQGLLGGKGSSFEEQFRGYAWALYNKKIAYIRSYIPDVTKGKLSVYGRKGTWTVSQTGMRFVLLTPMKGIPEATMLFNFVPGATGAPEGLFWKGTSRTMTPLTKSAAAGAYPEYVASFGKGVKQVVVVVLDPVYAAIDAANRTAEWECLTPRATITRLTAVSPITSGDHSEITLEYDLLGTLPDPSAFPVELKITEKGPDVADNVSGDADLPIGKKQTQTFYFNTDATSEGAYRFTFEYRTPSAAWVAQWGVPQVKSSKKVTITVNPPEAPRTPSFDSSGVPGIVFGL